MVSKERKSGFFILYGKCLIHALRAFLGRAAAGRRAGQPHCAGPGLLAPRRGPGPGAVARRPEPELPHHLEPRRGHGERSR